MVISTSSIDDLIKNQNPFAGHIVVRPQQIWGKSFPDVPSINAHASNAVFEAIEKIRKGQRETVGITITAERGLGKSHIISRIRHQLQTENSCLFVYMSKYDNLNQIKYQFLQTIASSLRAFGSQNLMQWQEIAAALINEAKQWNYTPQQYINLYPNWLTKHSTKVLDHFTELVLQIKPEITNPYIVRAILWTLSTVHANFATYWLSGLELTPAQAEAMGLPNPKSEDREAEALSTVRQILDITSNYRVPVICFDELDIADAADNGFLAAQVIASLVKDLYNSLKRGVLLLAMYPRTWEDQIKALPEAEAVIDRLASEQADRQPVKLNFLNSDDIVALVSRWLQDFYEENQQKPPHHLYPFDETKLREFGKSKPTVRSVLKWCAENFIPGKNEHIVQPYFDNELANVEASISSLMEEDITIATTLWVAFDSLIDETIEGFTIEAIEDVKTKASDEGFIDFRIVDKGRKVRIGVSVVQQDGHFIGAALKRLIDDEKRFDITRGCLVRSKRINPGATVARQRLRRLLTEKGGEWVALQNQDIKPLLAVYFVICNRESYDLTREQIYDFMKHSQLAINNPLIREILSDPSGQEPTNLTDDGLPISIPQGVATAENVELAL